MKKIFFILIISTFTIFGASIKIGYFDGFPSNFKNSKTGEVTGSTILYLKTFFKEMNYEVEFVGPEPFARILYMLEQGEIDALLGLSYTKERESFIYYPDKPYRSTIPYLVVLKTNILDEIKSPKDLMNMKLSYRNGAVLPEFLRNSEKDLNIEYFPRDTWIEQSLKMLVIGRIDGIITMSPDSFFEEIANTKTGNQIKMIKIPGNRNDIFLGISKKSKNAEIILRDYNNNLKKTKLKIETYDAIDFER